MDGLCTKNRPVFIQAVHKNDNAPAEGKCQLSNLILKRDEINTQFKVQVWTDLRLVNSIWELQDQLLQISLFVSDMVHSFQN